MPPPPYIDDGSHDLLQEVIAMEEMGREHTASPGKRKAVDLDADDELLGLAVDNDVKPIIPKAPIVEHRPEPIAPPKQEPESSVRKGKPKPKETPASTPMPMPKRVTEVSAPNSRPGSSKGKEKEGSAPPRTATPPKVKHSASPPVGPKASTPVNEKKCRDIIKNLAKLTEYGIFSRPVDTVMDGCPEYVR